MLFSVVKVEFSSCKTQTVSNFIGWLCHAASKERNLPVTMLMGGGIDATSQAHF